MRRPFYALVSLIAAFALVTGTSGAAQAAFCVKPADPRPCAGVKRCDWGGDPLAVFVEVHSKTKKNALYRAKKAIANVQRAKVRPRTLDVVAFKGSKVVYLKTIKLKGPHYAFSKKKRCWTVV